jgi:CheY-like chemotaxis protein
VFTVRLPLAARQADEVSERAHPARDEVPRQQRLRILVVDDNRDVADSLAEFLSFGGHQIRTEYSGAAGPAAAEEFKPRVIFCDLGMPGIDGHEVAARLRADSRHASAVLVAVTGWGTEEHKRRTQDAGFDMHLTKPVDLDEVERILSTF